MKVKKEREREQKGDPKKDRMEETFQKTQTKQEKTTQNKRLKE